MVVAKRSPGPRIVRAWFDTIINPLIDVLDFETRLLQQRNFTWRFQAAAFESIRKVGAHIDPLVFPNLKQFTLLNDDLDAGFRVHDDRVESLRVAVAELETTIVASPVYLQKFDSITSPESLEAKGLTSPTQVFGAYPKPVWPRLLAQYIINSSGDLQDHYTTAKLWNVHRPELLALLHTEGVLGSYGRVLDHAEALIEQNVFLLGRLGDLRLELSLRFDQPFVNLSDLRLTA